ncbi:hypothetical protein JIN84_07415 [Luteolibacter yonseiensis]|uniref:Nucleotidyltransferase AbiEii toxin of type IV toxin-antitoxin system n=1 Tax=Luteolibacter yonseiensis TaxID=1144680 RepID=A0A934VB06_9BACT|nr:hypothetical protein [Luteolibacter yonseiensis]MBK1815436.1 hypothetical protein [Luteolibacter yonseiensis]
MAETVQSFIDELTRQHRVVILGGLAVIAHGYSRHTQDADIWLDPLSSAQEWADAVESACAKTKGTTIHGLPGWVEISGAEVAHAAEETGMLRILGLNLPLDIFRRPNEFEEIDFDSVVSRTSPSGDGTLLPDPLDLIQSKLATGRDKDLKDIQHLESVIRADYKKRLPAATLEEATQLLERFSEWQVLQFALENPLLGVRDLAMTHLHEFAEAGDPFSKAILEGRELP